MSSYSFNRRRSYNLSDVALEDHRGSSSQAQFTPSSSQSAFDEQRILAQSGSRDVSSISDLLLVLAKSGIPGPRNLRVLNLEERGEEIGEGTQFRVFRSHPDAGGLTGKGYGDLEGLAVKRVKISRFRENGKKLEEGPNYRQHLRDLELEIVALCHPGLRDHRNIARLVAWGRDYVDDQTPLPVLFVELATCSLSDFIQRDVDWKIKHQLALDVVSGLAALHGFRIIHGDIKPDNVLVFQQHSSKVPFIAKLSDFGLCIDLFNSLAEISIDKYRGTPDWNAPELQDKSHFEHATEAIFNVRFMFKFDAYSAGLLLVSIFCTKGTVPQLKVTGLSRAEAALGIIENLTDIPSKLKTKIAYGARTLLDADPSKRPLLNSDILKTVDLISYQDWLTSVAIPPTTARPGYTAPEFNQGPAFWARLDDGILKGILAIASSSNPSEVHAETLFGLAIRLSTQPTSEYITQTIDFVQRAAESGYPPAQSICAQILAAHGSPLPTPEKLKQWETRSLETGSFTRPYLLSDEEAEEARSKFRRNGGHCKDGFLSIDMVEDEFFGFQVGTTQHEKGGPERVIDLEGSTIAHALAARGNITGLRQIFDQHGAQTLEHRNHNGETALYKACQAGQMSILRLFKQQNSQLPNIATRREGIIPLHWLFMFKESDMAEAFQYLAGPNNENINALMIPETSGSSTYHQNHYQMTHYPFEFPYGTPLHWASACQNFAAMEILLDHGADIDAQCFNKHPHSTPLSLAIHFGDLELATFLITRGACSTVLDAYNRTLLHRLTYKLPELHGSYPRQWHYWIRHGNWNNHVSKMDRMTALLLGTKLNIEDISTSYPPLTPLLTAASSGINDIGATMALLKAGADLNNAKGASKDSVLILFCSIASEKLSYPCGYNEVMALIVAKTTDLDFQNGLRQSALHIISSIDCSMIQFRDTVLKLLSKTPPANINLQDWDGNTPLLLTLMASMDPLDRALILLDQNANIYAADNRGDNLLGVITRNRHLLDDESVTLITTLLNRVDASPTHAFEKFENFSISALWNASTFSRPETLQQLLNLGLKSRVNEVFTKSGLSGGQTALDMALDYGEASRQAHMMVLSSLRRTLEPEVEAANYQLYDAKQGGAERAKEAYWAFPTTISLLRRHGAKRAWELGPEYNCENIEQPADYDLNNIYSNGFTPQTQPHREHWSVLYELAKYKPKWMQEHLDRSVTWYVENEYQPPAAALENWPELCQKLGGLSAGGWIRATSAKNLMVEVRMENGVLKQRE